MRTCGVVVLAAGLMVVGGDAIGSSGIDAGLAVAVVSFGAPDEAEPGPTLHERADEAFRAGNFERAGDLYLDVTDEHPDNALAWYRLGYCMHAQGKLEDAMGYHKRAAAFDQLRAPALYNLACAQALLGRTDAALGTLEGAASAGFADAATMEADSDLESLRADPRFAPLLRQVTENGGGAPLRAFDFWVGTWDVFNTDGTLVGHSVVKKLHNGRVIEENWMSAGGNTGMSLNFWDPEREAWRQVWVSMGGDVIEYEGGFRDGAMRFEGEHAKPDGTESISRASFEPGAEGTIRQFIEESADGGQTWTVYFEGTYVQRVLPLKNPPE